MFGRLLGYTILRRGTRNGITELSLLCIFNRAQHLHSEGGHHVGHRPTFLLLSEHELTFTFAICCRLSVCRLSVVCNVPAPYSGGSNFRQYFYGIGYPSHPLTSTENFTEIVPGEPGMQMSSPRVGNPRVGVSASCPVTILCAGRRCKTYMCVCVCVCVCVKVVE